MPAAAQKYLTPDQLIERWAGLYTKGTLANLRSKKKGPAYVKFGAKVLYPIDKLEEFEAAREQPTNDNTPT